MKDTIAVTGMGIICAIGNNAQQVLGSLKKGESGIGRLRYLRTKHTELPCGEVQLSNEQMAAMLGEDSSLPHSRTALMGAIAVKEALSQAGIKDVSGQRVVLISGTTVGDMDITEQYFQQMKEDDAFVHYPNSNECGRSTQEIARMAGLDGAHCCTISTACSSALNSIILGSEMLSRGEADIVIAGGSEALSMFHLNGFNTLMILDKERCRPFDDTRAGLNLGEGAAFVVLRKNTPGALAYVCGYGNRCDAFHQTASSDNGEGAFLAMSDALKMAGMAPCDIQYVNAHGTGTPNNDVSEGVAIQRVFGPEMPAVSSTKAFTGHTTSASGSIETVMCILAMQNGFIPANLGWKHQIPGGIIPSLGQNGVSLVNVMCNSFGFGGNDSSLVISSSLDVARKSALTLRGETSDVEVAADESVCDIEELPLLKEFISPMESRRMGKLMKAAMLCSLRALKKAGLDCPDAIVSATGRGMLEISHQFLDDIHTCGEELLKPTLFMQSTHNTIGSAMAIRTACHGYNVTYSQGDQSLDWALSDARRLIEDGKAATVLVMAFDEATEVYNQLRSRQGVSALPAISARSIVLRKAL